MAPTNPFERSPVAAFHVGGIPNVLCSDGSFWSFTTTPPDAQTPAIGWYELAPIPGSTRDAVKHLGDTMPGTLSGVLEAINDLDPETKAELLAKGLEALELLEDDAAVEDAIAEASGETYLEGGAFDEGASERAE